MKSWSKNSGKVVESIEKVGFLGSNRGQKTLEKGSNRSKKWLFWGPNRVQKGPRWGHLGVNLGLRRGSGPPFRGGSGPPLGGLKMTQNRPQNGSKIGHLVKFCHFFFEGGPKNDRFCSELELKSGPRKSAKFQKIGFSVILPRNLPKIGAFLRNLPTFT